MYTIFGGDVELYSIEYFRGYGRCQRCCHTQLTTQDDVMLLALPEVVMSWFSYVWREDAVIVLVGKRMAGCGRFRSAMVAIPYKELVKYGRPLCRCCSKIVATAVRGKYIVTVFI